ncbi:hypothetical protein Tco_0919196, partial [Tanacetum coccineum]
CGIIHINYNPLTRLERSIELGSIASKRTHKLKRLYKDRSDDAKMFDTYALIGDEVFAKKDITKIEDDVIPKEVSASEILTTAGITIPDSTTKIVSTAEIKTRVAPSTTTVPPPVITKVEITLAQTLAELNSEKSKVVIQEPVQSIVTITPSTIPKAKGITFRDSGETTTRSTPTSVSSSSIKDKGKAKMVKPEVPLKKKDQIRLHEELARRLDAEEQEAARLEIREYYNEVKSNITKIKSRRKEKKATNKRSEKESMSTYLKNIRGFTHNQLNNKSYEEIQKDFDNTMSWINSFKPMDSEEVKGSERRQNSSEKKVKG